MSDEVRPYKSAGEAVSVEPVESALAPGHSSTRFLGRNTPRASADDEAAALLVSHLFAQGDRDIGGVSYAVAYRLSDLNAGGDIVDVYHFDNDAVALAIADISGKGVKAAVHAALIKYGLRAYSSHGLTPEKAMRAMDRLYLENATFEDIESFASVFLGVVEPRRRSMTYASAGHEPIILTQPFAEPRVLPPTCPIIGVFDDQHHLFKQEIVDLLPGSLLVMATDGVTEARNAAKELFGMERLLACVRENRHAAPAAIVDAIIAATEQFVPDGLQDDVAVLAARFS
jgi:serine phosphatase RsbU (regulator of sigma subunit)